MKTIDRRRHYVIVLDTETTNTKRLPDGKLDTSNALVYDIGFQVVDTKGNIYERRSFVISEIFCDWRLMKGAYYANKITNYLFNISEGYSKIVGFMEARKELFKLMRKYNVKEIAAHNAIFDKNALDTTIRYITKSKERWFFPYSTEIWDTLKMARSVISKKPTYQAFCRTNGFMTAHKVPQVQLTAEVLYRYISGDTEFKEKHMGLDDVTIESSIMFYCYRQKKAMKKILFEKKSS